MYCPLCGQELASDEKGPCPNCGLPTEGVKEVLAKNTAIVQRKTDSDRKDRAELIAKGLLVVLMALPVGIGLFTAKRAK